MNRELKIYQVDAFTRTPMEGNAAGVVLDADSLTSKQMQAIARELNNSETAFLLQPISEDHDVRIRFFTPTTEVPTCGHATIAAHYVRAKLNELVADTYWHRIGIGRLPVEVRYDAFDYQIIMTQGSPQISAPFGDHQRKAVFDALNISPDDAVSEFPVAKVDTGASKVLVGVKSRDLLNDIAPNYDQLAELGKSINCKGFFVFTLADPDQDVMSHCRMFAPQIGILEDPVTGNGHGPLGAYLVRFDLTNSEEPSFYFRSRQGEAMGRPGTAQIWVDRENCKPKTVRVGGDAVIVFQTELRI